MFPPPKAKNTTLYNKTGTFALASSSEEAADVFSLPKLCDAHFKLLGKVSHPCAPSNSCGKSSFSGCSIID